MALETILRNAKIAAMGILSSLTFACSSCDKEPLGPVQCSPDWPEICNDGKDSDCTGGPDNGCDEDNDSYCNNNLQIIYQAGVPPSVCARTFDNCIPEQDCSPDLFKYDCDDLDNNINPGALELCNLYDDNCNSIINESFPEQGQKCGHGLGENLELDGLGRCSAGAYSCINGNLACLNYVGPAERELCNGIPDTCGLEPETVQTEARPCYKTRQMDQYGNVITIELPLNHPTIGRGPCITGIELCIDGVIGGDNECHGAKLPEPEIPDCKDNDCDGETDEGLHNNRKLQYAVAVDTSGSMSWILDSIKTWFSSVRIQDCFSDENIRVSTIRLGDDMAAIYEPVLKRSRATVREFRTNFNADIPGLVGPHQEPSANTIAYTACAVIEQRINYEQSQQQQTDPLPDICASLLQMNSLRETHPRNPLQQPVYDPDAEKALIVITDERYQWVRGQMQITPLVNQQEAARLISLAGIKIIIFTNLYYNDHITSSTEQGYGYFDDEANGYVLDLTTINPAEYLEDLIQNDYWRQ